MGSFFASLLSVMLFITTSCAAASPLHGRVVTQDPQARSGVFVTARSADSGIETSVYTGAGGEFEFPPLPASHYVVTAHHPRFEPASQAIDGGARESAIELELIAAKDPMLHASTAAWFDALADDALKREFLLNCASCHEVNASRIFKDGRVRDHARWVAGIKLMKSLDGYAMIPPDFDTDTYASWLSKSFAPERLASVKPQPLAANTLAAEQVVITEFPVPAANELPHDLVLGPDHRVWVTAFWNSQIWAMDPATGKFETFAVSDDRKTVAQVRALEFDRQGRLWLVTGGNLSVVMLDPRTRKFAGWWP